MNLDVVSGGYWIYAQHGAIAAPADATAYHFGQPWLEPNAVADLFQLPIWRTGVITDAYIWFVVAGTLASAQNSTMAIRINNTTDNNIVTDLQHTSIVGVRRIAGLSIAVTTGDDFEIKWTTPTWTTNPTNVAHDVRLFVRVP